MQLAFTNWLHTKYKFLEADSAKKGILRSFAETFYEYRNKKKFKNLGVVHPNYVANLNTTNARSANKDSNENQPSSFYSLKKAFKHLDLKNSDISLLDIGCGSGRVLSFGMLQKFKEVFGVDLDEPALKRAVKNGNAMHQLGYKTSFTISNEDACSYIIPESVNVIFLFNPFGGKTMEKVADNIFRHAERIKSNVYIIYSNPAHQEIFTNNKRCSKIFESYFKSKKPDISIFKLKASVFLNTASILSSMASLDNFLFLG